MNEIDDVMASAGPKMNAWIHLQFTIIWICKADCYVQITLSQIIHTQIHINMHTYVRRRYNLTAYWHLTWILESIFGFMHSNLFQIAYVQQIDISYWN